jgi:C4-dicarboxylate-specific signal transduction histidine kinase
VLPLLLESLVLLAIAALVGTLVVEYRRRREAEANARRYLATITHIDRLSMMGQLTASLTHELHQPLGAILRNSEAAKMLLSSGRSSMAEIHDIVEDIRKDDRRAAEIIRRMKVLLRKHEFSRERVDVNELVTETVTFVAPTARAQHVHVETSLHANTPIVDGDRVHLQQVLLNLILNGFDAMIRTPAASRTLVVTTTGVNSHVEVAVSDRGSGIPGDAIADIFEPFVTTKPEGMGIGLSIARNIIEAHHGQIVAENNAGGGATVRFSIPAEQHL